MLSLNGEYGLLFICHSSLRVDPYGGLRMNDTMRLQP